MGIPGLDDPGIGRDPRGLAPVCLVCSPLSCHREARLIGVCIGGPYDGHRHEFSSHVGTGDGVKILPRGRKDPCLYRAVVLQADGVATVAVLTPWDWAHL